MTTQAVTSVSGAQLNRGTQCAFAVVGHLAWRVLLGRSQTDEGSQVGRSVSLDHAARILGVSQRTVYNWIRVGRLRTIRTIGGSQRVLLDSLRSSNTSSGIELN
jgi:excisionase family DNA binding protein